MRVNVQLIETVGGDDLWAERFDSPFADLVDMQDEIVARLANALEAQLCAAEARRAEGAHDPDSIDLYFQAPALKKEETPEYMNRARDLVERALAIDPHNAGALVVAAWAEIVPGKFFASGDRLTRFLSAEKAVAKALSLASDHALAHVTLGMVFIYTYRAAGGGGEFERALARNRISAIAHALIGAAKKFLGPFDETEPHVLDALRPSPQYTLAHIGLAFVGA